MEKKKETTMRLWLDFQFPLSYSLLTGGKMLGVQGLGLFEALGLGFKV